MSHHRTSHANSTISDLLRAPAGPVNLADFDPDAHPGFDGDRAEAEKMFADMAAELAELQEKLFANGYVGDQRRLLLVIQGMDTSGKGGVLSHVVGAMSPSGIHLKSFKKPTKEELSHDFLWRIDKEVPAAGEIGIFDRSHYEDVLVVRVHELAPAEEVERRYGAINDWEAAQVAQGTTIVKCMLHISADEQKERLLARLDDPTKQWKFKPGDLDERALWPAYQSAYEVALSRCSTEAAPWFVIPANRKWYRNWAITSLLLEHLRAMALDWPAPDYDVSAQKTRLAGETAPA